MDSDFNHQKRLRRVRRLLRRQPTSAWTQRYVPGIKATREEAPSRSRPSILCDRNITEREIHLMSLPERAAAMVALSYPHLINLEEQKVLQPLPDVHPLTGHPRAPVKLPDLPGTVWAYRQLGAERRHPMIRVREDEVVHTIPDVLVGDLLLTLEDQLGIYCVNWSVKCAVKDFGVPPDARGPEPLDKKTLRTAAEELNYAAADIPTRQISSETFDRVYVDNLTTIFCWQSNRQILNGLNLDPFALLMRAVAAGPLSLPELSRVFILRYRLTREHFRAAIGVLIWDGVVRADLFRRILLDEYLYPEEISPMIRYGHLFERGGA